jgi:hypothetical protein
MRKTYTLLVALFLISLIVVAPFLYNNYRMWLFSRQLSLIDYLSSNIIFVGSSSAIVNLDNSEACSFLSTRIYMNFATGDEQIALLKRIKEHEFTPINQDQGRRIRVEIFMDKQLMVALLRDGPYTSFFDPRCW